VFVLSFRLITLVKLLWQITLGATLVKLLWQITLGATLRITLVDYSGGLLWWITLVELLRRITFSQIVFFIINKQ